MKIGINPTVDFAFKRVFGDPEHTDVTIHFLNAVLGGSSKITQIEILNPILDKDHSEDKLAVLDIRAQDELGRLFNIEMQTSLPTGMAQRLTYYTACLFAEQMHAGDAYVSLRPAISICILGETMFREACALHLDFRLCETRSGFPLSDDLQIHLIQLPQATATSDNVWAADALEKWAYFLRFAEELSPDEVSIRLPEREFSAAAGVLEMIARTPEERIYYEARLKFQRDAAARLQGAREEGVQIGRVQLLQQILGLPRSSVDDLAALRSAELTALEDDLQRQLSERH